MSNKASMIYISSLWQQHESLITHLSKHCQNMILVVAPQAGGKTTFLEYMLTNSSGYKKSFTVKSCTNVEDLLKQVAIQFELTWNASTLKSQLELALETLNEQNHQVQLWIDEAHLLSNEQLQALMLLLDFEQESGKQMQLILLGEPSLELRLFSPEFAELSSGKIYTIELESWSQQDIQALLEKRGIRFNQSEITTIFEKSSGVPGQVINEIKNHAGFDDIIKKKRNKKISNFRPIVLGILAGFAIGGAYLLWNNNIQEENTSIPINAAQISESAWSAKETSKQTSPAVVFHFDNDDTADDVQEEVQENIKTSQPIVETPNESQTSFQEASGEEVTKPVQPQDLEMPASVPAPVPELESKIKAPESTAKEESTLQVKKNNDVSHANHVEDQPLLLKDKHHYTLQLFGTYKESTVKEFIKKYSLTEKSYTFKTKRQGKDWYVVVYGDYGTIKEAKIAANDLKEIQQAKVQPWVRDFGSVQQDILG
ncbi:MAG: AAA family ATPase [Proteobacteria bacterium]|nr:AAA family ATPase [Pseudomonadota bacterium]